MLPSCRALNITGVAICVAALLFAILYLEQTLGLDPCPLCVIDRVLLIVIGLIFLLAAIHNPHAGGRKGYAILISIVVVLGFISAGRHIWLQHLPKDKIPECGPDIYYLINNLPVVDAIKKIFKGSGQCAAVDWTFLGLSIPAQTLGLFLIILAIALIQLFRQVDQR